MWTGQEWLLPMRADDVSARHHHPLCEGLGRLAYSFMPFFGPSSNGALLSIGLQSAALRNASMDACMDACSDHSMPCH